jgi:hypothetical protein
MAIMTQDRSPLFNKLREWGKSVKLVIAKNLANHWEAIWIMQF